jgi:hypothetical protein
VIDKTSVEALLGLAAQTRSSQATIKRELCKARQTWRANNLWDVAGSRPRTALVNRPNEKWSAFLVLES